MDPTTQAMGQDPQALQNALILQAIKSGAAGGVAPTPQAMPPSPLTAPGNMTGGLGAQMAAGGQPAMPGQAMQPMGPGAQQMPPGAQDPAIAALFSQIPPSGQ